MNDLFQTSLFTLLSEPSQEVSNIEMQKAYGKFMEHIELISNSDDYATGFRTLNFTRIELLSIESVFWYEQGGKCA